MQLEFACTACARLRGLTSRAGFDGVLVLAPCNDIHTFTMRSPIDVAFAAADGVVLEVHRAVPPFRRLHNRQAALVVERFAVPGPWLEAGDALELSTSIRADETACETKRRRKSRREEQPSPD